MRARGNPRRANTGRTPRSTPDAGWLSIKVELTQGRGETFVAPAGRLFAAAPDHTFAALATQINAAFARWDGSHLHEFELADGTRIGPIDDEADEDVVDEAQAMLSRLKPAEPFTYTFDFGEMWLHRCVVTKERIDPAEVLGIVPKAPVPYSGWGSIPDQYGRASFEGDD